MPRIRTLIFIRHGETDYNKSSLIQGRGVNAELNENGIYQATNAGKILSHLKFEYLACSKLKRAAKTAEIIKSENTHCMENKLECHYYEDLEEMCFGDLEGKYYLEATRGEESCFHEVRNVTQQWCQGREDFNFPNGENPLQVKERAFRCLRSILKENIFELGLFVTHGRFLKVLMTAILQVPYDHVKSFGNCNFAILKYSEEKEEFFIENDEYALLTLPDTLQQHIE